MSDCLHCDINELVQKHLEMSETVDATDLAIRMAESLAEFIVFVVPPGEQTKVLAQTIGHLGQMVIDMSETGKRDTAH